MAPATVSDLIDHFKLETEFLQDCTLEITRTFQQDQGRRMIKVEKRWIKQEDLGWGTFGEVWLEKNQSGEARAVKCVRKNRNIGMDYHRELLAMAKLSKHQDIFVRFYGWFENVDSIFIAMEYFQYGDLHKFILKSGPCTELDAKMITIQLLEGLEVMHGMGFTHRDLKPQNIFVAQRTPEWWVKIGDFGIAKRVLENDPTALRTEIGTRAYRAPEVEGLADESQTGYTKAVDLWSLGCVTYWLLTQTVPFPSTNELCKFISGRTDFPLGHLRSKGITNEGMAFLQKTIAVQPLKRFTALTALDDPWVKGVRKVPCQDFESQDTFDDSGSPLDHPPDESKAGRERYSTIQQHVEQQQLLNPNKEDVPSSSIEDAIPVQELFPPQSQQNMRKPLRPRQLQTLRTRPFAFTLNDNYWRCDCISAKHNYGGEATFSIYRPHVEMGDHSILAVAVVNNGMGFMQTVEAGWRRDPTDGDGDVKFFTFYATRGFEKENLGNQKGGYNTDVTGWLPITGSFPQPGDNLQYSQAGREQTEIKIKWQLFRDSWYLFVDGNPIGSYDASLFSNGFPDKSKTLAAHATQIHFYGEVFDAASPDPRKTPTHMGSGNFPNSGRMNSAYIRNMTYQPLDIGDKMVPFDGFAFRDSSSFDPLRYNMQEHFYSDTHWGSFVWIGGPGSKRFDWLMWDTIGNGNKTDGAVLHQGGPITAVARRPDVIDLFMVADNGKVYTTWWTGSNGWSGSDDTWMAIGGGNFPPTAKVAAVARHHEIIDLFCVGNDGKVYTNCWIEESGWAFSGSWKSIGGSFPKEAEVTAVARSKDSLDLFICDAVGKVYTASWADAGPSFPGPNDRWSPISQFDTFPPANKVSAVARSKDHLDLFICSRDGEVHWATWSSTSSWSSLAGAWTKLGGGVSPASFPATAGVVAVSRQENNIDLFVCANDGQVYTSWWTQAEGWLTPGKPWQNIGGQNEFSSGYPLVALARQKTILDLFICGTDGYVYTSWWTDGNGWSGVGDNWRCLRGTFQKGFAAQITAVARTQANIDIFVADSYGHVNQTAWGG